MSLHNLISHSITKNKFISVEDYISFCNKYLEYIKNNLQAIIVSNNENHYNFYQYNKDGHYNITRPINSKLMYGLEEFYENSNTFISVLNQLREGNKPDDKFRDILIRTIYTIQQSIGATLDALPVGESNKARKINGDLFERLICTLIQYLNIDCVYGSVKVPVKDNDNKVLFHTRYQHDLLISSESELKIIGSVKTSSKDRIDKIFLDKFLYSKLTETMIPHIAIFLNDVQRKKTKKENQYGISTTFLPGHFKAYTIKLNPLDGVYYCDIRQSMLADNLLSQHIKTIDVFFYNDLRSLINVQGQSLKDVIIDPEK